MRQSNNNNNYNSTAKINTKRFAVSFGRGSSNRSSHCWPDAFSTSTTNGINKNNNQRQQKITSFNWLSSENNNRNNNLIKIHVHTLYLILCIVLVNLIVLLCIIHFRLFLIFPANDNYNNSKLLNKSDNFSLLSLYNNRRLNNNNTAIRNAQVSHTRNQKSEEHLLREQEYDNEEIIDNINIFEKNNNNNNQLEKVKFNILKQPNENIQNKKEKINNNGCCITSTISTLLDSDFDLLNTSKSSTQKIVQNTHYLVNCTTEEDTQGIEKCVEWQRAGFCKSHPATKWLFCRRQCLCF